MKLSNVLWGIVLIVLGLIIGLNEFEITNIDIFFDGWWTLIIIIPCFINLFKEKEKTGNIIGLLIGLGLLLSCQNIIEFDDILRLAFPTILVIVGLSIMFKNVIGNEIRKEIKSLEKSDKNTKEFCSTFSSQLVDYTKEKFEGCSLQSIFGGIKCDLRQAEIKENCLITASSIFGGTTIYVPDNVNVKITSNSVFGGVSDERKNKTYDNKITIYINATCIFGGVEIK